MNSNATTSTSSSAATRSARDNPRQPDPLTLRREGDRFERLLREKSKPCEDDEDSLPPLQATDAPPPLPMSQIGPPSQAPQAAVPAAVARAGAAAHDTASATQAALGSAMASQAPQQPQAGTAEAHTFQVSIQEPMGLPLELRAVRVPAAGNVQAPALWALNISAPSRDATQLGRHGSRLDERLRARGLDPAHVRIDGRPESEDLP